MVITNDHAWLSTFNGEMNDIERVLGTHDVRIENRQYFTNIQSRCVTNLITL